MPTRPPAGGTSQRADDRRGGHAGRRLADHGDDHPDEDKDEPSHPVRRCRGHGPSFASYGGIRQPTASTAERHQGHARACQSGTYNSLFSY
jgi:hypothetical protein